MNFDIDIIIVIAFLLLTMCVGLLFSRQISNINQYALGNRNFSTVTLAMTIAATWIGGGVLSQTLAETYKQGLYFIIPAIGDSLVLALVGIILIPKMVKFLGSISIADTMGKLYGKPIKFITTITAVMSCVGAVAIQLKVSVSVLELFFDVSSFYGVILVTCIVITYSAFGGIKSVTFTDIMQILTFSAIMPIISIIIWGTFDDPNQAFTEISNNSLFDFEAVFDLNNARFFESILLFLFFIIPSLESAIFQRVAMARDINQAKQSFVLAAIICLVVTAIIAWVGVLLLSDNPNLDSNNLLSYTLDKYSYPGLRGMMAIGIIAIVMSTADSYINSASVMISDNYHDFFNTKHTNDKKLLFTRISAVLVGFIAFFLAFNTKSLLELTLIIWGAYMPIITVPLMMAIFGYKTTYKPVLLGMIAGILTLFLFKILEINIQSVLPAMLANFVTVNLTRILLNEPGGWQKDISSHEPYVKNQKNTAQVISNYWNNFRLLESIKKHAPANEFTYSFFAIFCIISIYSTMYSIDVGIRQQYTTLFNIIYHSVLIISSIFLTYSIWPDTFKNQAFISCFWFINLFYILIFIGCLQVIVSQFGEFQLMIFMVNILILSILTRWQISIVVIITGIIASIEFFKLYANQEVTGDLSNLQFKVIYLLLLVSSVLLAFFKPKQEYLEETEAKVGTLEKEVTHLDHELTDLNGQVINLNEQVDDLSGQVDHYSQRVSDHEQEIERLGSTAQKILNNVNHELRLPIGNVVNFSDMLHEALQKSDNYSLKELSEEVFKNSTRISTMILNMLDLATLEVKKVDLQKKTINFGELVENRVRHCRKIYLQGKKIDFELSIQPEVMIAVDPNYIRQMVDNIVINALSYSTEGLIKVNVYKVSRRVELIIEDQGIGIPLNEIYDIFDPFKMGSKTDSRAEGRGVGLALCKSVAEAHDGKIIAESDGKKGASFTVTLPLYPLS